MTLGMGHWMGFPSRYRNERNLSKGYNWPTLGLIFRSSVLYWGLLWKNYSISCRCTVDCNEDLPDL